MKILKVMGMVLLFVGAEGCRSSTPAPVTVTFLDIEYEASSNLTGLGEDLQAFTRETGIQVKRLPAPDSSLKQLALWKELLKKGESTPDVYGIDVIWAGILKQNLMDLRPAFGSEVASENPVVLAAYTADNQLVAVPRHAYINVLVYRADLLERYGYRGPPKTWDELGMMAGRIQAGERARGEKDFWGYVWPGGIDEDLTCTGLEWQVSEGGGRIIEEDQTISVNNPQTIRVWKRAAGWAGSIAPAGLTAFAKWDVDNLWSSGKAAFAHSWVSDYSLIAGPPRPAKVTRFGVSNIPGGRGGRSGTLGGNGLAVSRTSGHPREALELIRFLRQRDVQFMRANENSVLPKELELLQLPDVLKLYPKIAKIRQNGGGVVARPSIAAGAKYEEVSRAYIGALHSVLAGEKTAAVAAANLEKELIGITGFRTGPPK
jgi:trehalose/maltose transport system substrate-binding protein